MSIYLVYPLNKIDGLLIVMGGLSIFALRYGYEWKYRNIMFFLLLMELSRKTMSNEMQICLYKEVYLNG